MLTLRAMLIQLYFILIVTISSAIEVLLLMFKMDVEAKH